MPKANFWIVLSVKGDDASRIAATHAFDMHESATVYQKAHSPSVLLGGKTVSDAAAKCFGRLPTGSLIKVQYELPRNATRPHATIPIPDRGPVTVLEKRENRAGVRAAKVDRRAAAAAGVATVVEIDAEIKEEEKEEKEEEEEEEDEAARKAARKLARKAARKAVREEILSEEEKSVAEETKVVESDDEETARLARKAAKRARRETAS
jgi:hypothetical protein